VRILILHSRYASGAASGENRVVEDEVTLLRAAGHDVQSWEPSPSRHDLVGKARLGGRAIWSGSAAREVRERIRKNAIELVHIHNLFPMLSPAVLRSVGREGVPSIVTLHNYRFMCLPASLLRDQRVCEDCVGRRVAWPGVVHRCYRGSAAGSAALAASIGAHRALGTFDLPASYLAVSDFVRSKYLDAGWPAHKILVKPNFAWETSRRRDAGSYFLYAGRLSPEKGVATLLEAARGIRARVVVAGTGPDEERLRAAAPPGVEFRGAVASQDVPSLIRAARGVLVPSLSFEGQPRIVLESSAAGVPVAASRLGGLPDLVSDGGSGLLVRPGDAIALRAAMERLLDDEETRRLGDGAWRRWQELYSPSRALQNLEAAYRRAVDAA
jgi:glycosyltransferase involved in cell wall biosynthesis